MSRASREFLVVLPHPPEPDGPPVDRTTYRLLTWLGRHARLCCVSEAPPVSTQLLRLTLARKGVELLDGLTPGSDAFFGRIQKAVRGKRFDAAVLVGPSVVDRWARSLRLLVPRQVVFYLFPDAAALAEPLERFSAGARQGVKVKWRGLLSLADGIWTRSRSDRDRLERCFAIEPAKLDVLPANDDASGLRWISACMARRARLRRSLPRQVSVVAPDLPTGEAERLRRAVRAVTGRKPLSVPVAGSGTSPVRRMNRALSRGRWSYALVCLHPLAPSENLVRTLLEGMHVLSYAGAAVPLDFSAVRPALGKSLPMKDGLFAAAWALRNKGGWHEVDYPVHFCCLLLRRAAWEAAGLLDERFRVPEYAWVDYFLRLQQAGYPVLSARDALAFCGLQAGGRPCSPPSGRALAGQRGGRPAQAPAVEAEDRDLLVEKWCKGSLKLMESLLTALEPRGYRSDSGTVEACR